MKISYYLGILCSTLLLIQNNVLAEDGKHNIDERDTLYISDYNYEIAGLSVTYHNPTAASDSIDIFWDFGDGVTSKKFYQQINTQKKFATITHTYKAMGYYQTCMTMIHSQTKEVLATKCQYIELLTPDLCDWTWEPVCGCDNQTYSNSCVAEDFHGVYSWTKGECEQTIMDLEVGYLHEVIDETGGLLTSFTNTSTGNYDAFIWDFGDGSFSDARNPKHLYKQEGIYNICLTVTSELTQQEAVRCEDVNIQHSRLADD